MTFRSRNRHRNRRLQGITSDAELYERLQQRRRNRGVPRPVLWCLLLIWGVSKSMRWTAVKSTLNQAVMDPTNDSLQLKHGRTHKLFFRQQVVAGPETVLIRNNDNNKVLVLTEHGTLVELLTNDSSTNDRVVDTKVWSNLGIGRPLGGRFASDNTLYIADAALGLTRLRQYEKPTSHVELLVSTVTVLTENGTTYESPLLYVNAVAIGPKTGNVYFTDSTDIAPDRIYKNGHWVWDTMFASKLDLIRGKPMGRVCEYNPKTKQVRVLADGIYFANGIAVDPVHEEWIVVAETFGTRMLQYTLPPRSSSTTLLKPSDYLQPHSLVDPMTGYVDNADCAVVKGTSYCFGAIISAFSPIHRFYTKLPLALELLVRNLLLLVPRSMAPKVHPTYTGIVRINMVTQHVDYIQDPTASDVQLISGVTVKGNELYLGSLTNDHIVVYNLETHDEQWLRTDRGNAERNSEL